MKQTEKPEKPRRPRIEVSYIPLALTALVTVAVIYLIYNQTQEILKEKLRQRLMAIASTAAVQFKDEEIEQIQSKTDLQKEDVRDVIERLGAIRSANEHLIFIYIFRQTSVPNQLEFVADADMLATTEELDANRNGIVDEDEAPPLPGDPYDLTQLPPENASELIAGFSRPTATRTLGSDQWGTYLSGFAPIQDKNGNTVGVLGLDVSIGDFYAIIRAMLTPLLVLSILLLLMLTAQTIALIRIWRNRVEIVKELDRQKDELLSIVSHQLATPVSSMKFNLEMMADGDFGEITGEARETVTGMQKIAVNLADLVSMILDVSRIQLGRMMVDPQPLNLNEFFQEILTVIDPKAQEKGVVFTKNVVADLPTVLLDKRLTRMTIENMVSNAVKYTSKGGTVTFTVEKRDGDELYCEVRDSGCGIPKDEQGKIFGKMFRASNVRNAVDGNGFGLYIAKGAIESQGGEIWFESEENKGTTFFVTLPLHEANQCAEEKDSQPAKQKV